MAKKYIDADKLIATLERQNVDKKVVAPLIRIIDSLQQESPEVDLEEELEQYARNHPADDAGSYRNLIGIAHHFYELGKNSK